MKEEYNRISKYLHRLHDARADTFHAWQDAAAQEICERFINPLCEDSDNIQRSTHRVVTHLALLSTNLSAGAAELARARTLSNDIDSHLESFDRSIDSFKKELTYAEQQLREMYASLEMCNRLLQSANDAGLSFSDDSGYSDSPPIVHDIRLVREYLPPNPIFG